MSFLEQSASRRPVENFIYTVSPFSLQKPADWFLDELYAHDPQLRIFASMSDPLYRIMRKMTVDAPWTTFLKHKPDTAIAVAHGLYPVTSVNPSVLLGFSWARVLLDLQERDQWKFRHAGVVAGRLEGAEEDQEQRIVLSQGDEADQRAIDLYRAYRGATGSRTSLAYRTPDGVTAGRSRPSARPRRAYRPQGAGTGAFFTGRNGAVSPGGRPRGALVGV
jgi:hypothetical protein